VDANGVRLGALARMQEVADHPAIRNDYRVLSDSPWMAASPQPRNMASQAGNVLQRTRCNYFRDPSWAACNKRNPGRAVRPLRASIAAWLCSASARITSRTIPAILRLRSRRWEPILDVRGQTRTMLFEHLHRLPGDTPHLETRLQPGELITGIQVPAGPWTRRSLYLKIRDRESYDFALASAAVALELAPDRKVRAVRIEIGGPVAKPWRSHEAEATLIGRVLDESSARDAASEAFASAVVHSETAFKPELGRRTLVRALLEAAALEI
jgi:xanthine dehydrogenase YagS FAD-binding subunit